MIDDMRRQRKKHDIVSYVLQRAMNDLMELGNESRSRGDRTVLKITDLRVTQFLEIHLNI